MQPQIKLARAADEREHFLWRVFDQIQMGVEQFQRDEQVAILLAVFAEECCVGAESRAPFCWRELRKELVRPALQAHEDAVEFFRGKALAGGEARDITHQIGELVVADANTEVLPGDFFNLVCFVEDDGAVFGNDARVLFVPHREIGEEEVMVDDDDVALMRLAMHLGDEATLELLALLAGAGLAAGVDFGPRR